MRSPGLFNLFGDFSDKKSEAFLLFAKFQFNEQWR